MTGTTNLNLTKPTVGADSDVWGNELNSNLDILDALLVGDIYGLTLSASGSTATFGVAAGAASGMILGSAYTKTTGSWAVGSTQGALDTGTIANNTWYHVWLIQRTDTSVVDVLVSTSASSPTMPTNYTRKRRIGAMKTDGSAQWVKFAQLGDEFIWSAPVTDFNTNLTSADTAQLISLTVPSGVQVVADAIGIWGGGPTMNDSVLVSSPDEASVNSNTPNGNLTAVAPYQGAGASYVNWSKRVRTNTSGQVRATGKNTSALLQIVTRGWTDPRGKW